MSYILSIALLVGVLTLSFFLVRAMGRELGNRLVQRMKDSRDSK